MRLSLQLTPEQLRQMDSVTFTIRLSDAHGHPVEGANVTADLTMPTMDMGADPIMTHPQGHGVYKGAARFTMNGDWNIIVKASKGSQTASQTVPVHVR